MKTEHIELLLESVRDLASQQAGIIQKMGASYGNPEEWRHDFTNAVKIMEQVNVALVGVVQP